MDDNVEETATTHAGIVRPHVLPRSEPHLARGQALLS